MDIMVCHKCGLIIKDKELKIIYSKLGIIKIFHKKCWGK